MMVSYTEEISFKEKMRPENNVDCWESVFKLLQSQAEAFSADQINVNFHNCFTFKNWCLEITLRKHTLCDEEKE